MNRLWLSCLAILIHSRCDASYHYSPNSTFSSSSFYSLEPKNTRAGRPDRCKRSLSDPHLNGKNSRMRSPVPYTTRWNSSDEGTHWSHTDFPRTDSEFAEPRHTPSPLYHRSFNAIDAPQFLSSSIWQLKPYLRGNKSPLVRSGRTTPLTPVTVSLKESAGSDSSSVPEQRAAEGSGAVAPSRPSLAYLRFVDSAILLIEVLRYIPEDLHQCRLVSSSWMQCALMALKLCANECHINISVNPGSYLSRPFPTCTYVMTHYWIPLVLKSPTLRACLSSLPFDATALSTEMDTGHTIKTAATAIKHPQHFSDQAIRGAISSCVAAGTDPEHVQALLDLASALVLGGRTGVDDVMFYGNDCMINGLYRIALSSFANPPPRTENGLVIDPAFLGDEHEPLAPWCVPAVILHLAVIYSRDDIVAFILRRNHKALLARNRAGDTALLVAAGMMSGEFPEALGTLLSVVLSLPVVLAAKDYDERRGVIGELLGLNTIGDGLTIVDYAIHRRNPAMLECILQKPLIAASINLSLWDPSKKPQSSIHRAIKSEMPQLVEQLLSFPDECGLGQSLLNQDLPCPLALAISTQNALIVDLLVNDPRVNINRFCSNGDCALTMAVKKKRIDILRILLTNENIVPERAFNAETPSPLMKAYEMRWSEGITEFFKFYQKRLGPSVTIAEIYPTLTTAQQNEIIDSCRLMPSIKEESDVY